MKASISIRTHLIVRVVDATPTAAGGRAIVIRRDEFGFRGRGICARGWWTCPIRGRITSGCVTVGAARGRLTALGRVSMSMPTEQREGDVQ